MPIQERDGPIVPAFCTCDDGKETMKRIGLTSLLLFVVTSSVGCVYSPGYMDPYTGIPRGGTWRPVCGGPADPLGIGCAINYGNPYGQVPYNYSYPNVGRGYGWPNACDPCCDDGTMIQGGGYPQTFAPGSSCDGCINSAPMQAVPNGGPMAPTPDPKGSKSQTASSGAMTNVYVPQAPPAVLPAQGSTQLPSVQAH